LPADADDTRRELWPQAELFFALCHARATPRDPLPPWIDKAEQQLAAKLAETGAAPITIRVNPLEAKPHISVSSFAPDESFPPRTIHLARGRHVLEISAPGYVSTSREVVVDTSDPRTVVIDLQTTIGRARRACSALRGRREGGQPCNATTGPTCFTPAKCVNLDSAGNGICVVANPADCF
jgi:hypothetical protein